MALWHNLQEFRARAQETRQKAQRARHDANLDPQGGNVRYTAKRAFRRVRSFHIFLPYSHILHFFLSFSLVARDNSWSPQRVFVP